MIEFGYQSSGNTVNVGCEQIIFGNTCIGNSIGILSSNITLSDYNESNTIGNDCNNIKLYDMSCNNTIGNNCSNITIKKEAYNNVISSNCDYIEICDFTNTCAFNAGVKHILCLYKLLGELTYDGFNNIKVLAGNKNIDITNMLIVTSTNSLITPDINVNYCQIVTRTSNDKVICYNPGDLAQALLVNNIN